MTSVCVVEERVERLISRARSRYDSAVVMKEQVEVVKTQYSSIRHLVKHLVYLTSVAAQAVKTRCSLFRNRWNRVINLARTSQASYDTASVINEQMEAVKTQYSSARYRVNSLASAPAATSLSDLPDDVANSLFSAASDANKEVKRLRKTVAQLLMTLNIKVETVLSMPDETIDAPQTDDAEEGREASIGDLIARELRVACDTYETARQLIVSAMEDCDRLVRLALSGVKAVDKDEVLFSARGELVTASRSSLLRTKGAHPIEDDSAMLNLIIASIVDKSSLSRHIRKLDASSRDYLVTRLDYYQVLGVSFNQIIAHSSNRVVYDVREVSLSKFADDGIWRGAIWDPSIRRFSVTIDASNIMFIMVGFAPAKIFDISKCDYKSCGWYLYLYKGNLCAQVRVNNIEYTSECKIGDTISCFYDASSREISFERNGVSLGVAYSNIIGEDIAPAVGLYHTDDRITLSACLLSPYY